MTAATMARAGGMESFVGQDAEALLGDPSFVREWGQLSNACPWGTLYQTPAFALPWYRVYHEAFEPLLIVSRDDEGLDGLLLLARAGEEGGVVHVGAHHAEYQGWLSTPAASAGFVASAMKRLQALGVRELQLHMASPRLPLDDLRALEQQGIRTTVRSFPRGFMRVGAGSDIEASLRKKGNKSRIARLARNGPLELVHLTSPEELDEVFDTVIPQCDLRQGATHQSLPFSSDARKREFYLAMMAVPGVLHATVLRSGNIIHAAHVGPVDRDYVSLGLITHSPFSAAHSPGKLLLLLLGKLLGEQGHSVFDLTPGGSYKERFADAHDDVPSVAFHLSPLTYARARGRQLLVRSIRSAGAATGVDARAAGERVMAMARRVRRAAPAKLARTAFTIGRRWAASDREFRVYTMQPDEALAFGTGDGDLSVNEIAHLLHYEQTAGDPPVPEFLRLALQRLESGQYAFTQSQDRLLLHNSWLIPSTTKGGSEFGHHFHFAQAASVLWADFTHPVARGRGLHQASIRARAALAAREAMAPVICIGVRADNAPSRHNIEKLGFRHVGSAFLRTRLGRSERWLEGDFLRDTPIAAVAEERTPPQEAPSHTRAKPADRVPGERVARRNAPDRERAVQHADDRAERLTDRSVEVRREPDVDHPL